MRRREYVRAIGGATSVTILGGLAGCSGDGGSGSTADSPLDATVAGPYTHRINEMHVFLWARLTLEGPPNDWPEGNYYEPWVGSDSFDSRRYMSAVSGDEESPNFRFEKSDFADDGSVTVDGLIGEPSEFEPETTFTFFVRSPETEEFMPLVEVTYAGNAAEQTPSKIP